MLPYSVSESLKVAVSNRTYEQIPDILKLSEESSCKKQNPFSFLSGFVTIDRTRMLDEMLQSFIPLKPHTRLKLTYQYLLLYTLQSSNSFPLALAVLDILLDMKSIGYHPDCGDCNYIIKSLCNVAQLEEAVEVLHGMVGVGCIPDIDSYSSVIAAFCQLRKTDKAVALMKEMVGKMELSPRQGTLVQLVAALQANKEIWRAAEMIEFLVRKGTHVGFESYEVVVEGCLECKEFILAGKMVMMMTDNGFIPYIEVRQEVVEGLAGVGKWELACTVRHRCAKLNWKLGGSKCKGRNDRDSKQRQSMLREYLLNSLPQSKYFLYVKGIAKCK